MVQHKRKIASSELVSPDEPPFKIRRTGGNIQITGRLTSNEKQFLINFYYIIINLYCTLNYFYVDIIV